MKSSMKKSVLFLTLSTVLLMTLVAVMAFSQVRQEREPAELRQRHQRAAMRAAVAGQAEVSPPWAYPFQELAIPACAFRPVDDADDYYASHFVYMNTGSGTFYAPIILPDNTQIKRVILCAWDTGAGSISLYLYRNTNTASYTPRIGVMSTGTTSGYRRFVSSYVSYTVNNQARCQYLQIYLPGPWPNYEVVMAKILYKNCYWPT